MANITALKSTMSAKQNTEQVISECKKVIQDNFKKYIELVETGSHHISLIIAHKTTVQNVATANIKETDLHEENTDVKEKLEFTIKKEISEEEQAIVTILNDLDKIFSILMRQCDKAINIFSSNIVNDMFSVLELPSNNGSKYSFMTNMDCFCLFKEKLTDLHWARKYSCCCNLDGDVNELPTLWKASCLQTIQNTCYAVFSS